MNSDNNLPNYEVDAANHPCPVCGNKLFEWGIVSRFTPLSYRRGFQFFRFDKTQGVKARHCLTCNHLQFFVDEELAAEQRRAAIIVWIISFVAIVIAVSVVLSLLSS